MGEVQEKLQEDPPQSRKTKLEILYQVEQSFSLVKLKKALDKDPFQPKVIAKDDGPPFISSEEALNTLLPNWESWLPNLYCFY